MKRILFVTLKFAPMALLLLLCQAAHSATPQKINYQGYLKAGGIPVTAATNFVFKICDAANCGGTVYCTETANGVTVTNGRFSWLIGTDVACDLNDVPWGALTLYIQTTVNGQVLTPSEEIVSAPFALGADGTPETTYTIDRDNAGAGANTSLAFERGTSNANDALLTWDEAIDSFVLTSNGSSYATVTMGVASAAKYYGDGSSLTGIGASDTTKVLKTGDTMTGPLAVGIADGTAIFASSTGGGTATSALYVKTDNSNANSYGIRVDHTGAGLAVYGYTTGTGIVGRFETANAANANPTLYGLTVGGGYAVYGRTTGTGRAGNFEIDNAANTSNALTGYTIGTGNAGYFGISNAGSAGSAVGSVTNGSGSAVFGQNTGTGHAGRFWVSNAAGSGSALYASTSGLGHAEEIWINNAGNASDTVNARTNGSGSAVFGQNTGTGHAGRFFVNNAASPGSAVYASTSGTGNAAQIWISNAGSVSDTMNLSTAGTGNILAGNHTGASGNLLKLQSGGNNTFVVDKSGNVYATGSFITLTGFASATTYYGDGSNLTGISAGGGVAKTGDTMTGGLTVNFNTATESVKIINQSDGSALVIDNNGNTTASAALYVEMNSADVNSVAVKGMHSGAGYAIHGTGSGSSHAVGGYNTGTGKAGFFVINNAGNASNAVQSQTNGSGNSIFGYNTGAGKAGAFQVDNASNGTNAMYATSNGSGHSVYGVNTGTGNAGVFQIINASSGANGLYAISNGTGALYLGNHTGASGDLMELQNSGSPMFYVDNTGNVNATGSFITLTGFASATTYYGDGSNLTGISASDATKVAKTGDTMTGGLEINLSASTESLYVVNSGNTGTGYGARITTTGPANASATLNVQQGGLGQAGFFEKTQDVAGAALVGKAAGTGATSYGVMGSAPGGGIGVIGLNPAGGVGVAGQNSGIGYGVFAQNTDTGVVFAGNHTGTSGKLMDLETNSVKSFIIDRAGNVYATGTYRSFDLYSFAATGSGYINFGPTLGAGGYGFRDNAGQMEFKDSAGGWTDFNALGGGNAVQKTGDTMTGPLGLSQGAATATIYAYQTGTTDDAGHFELTNAGSTAVALRGITAGTASASYGVYGEATAIARGVGGFNNGGGVGVYGSNTSTGYGVYGANNNTGYGIFGANYSATTGQAARFEITSPTNTDKTLSAVTAGTGRAGAFQINNASNSDYTVAAGTTGTGVLYWGNHTGASGNLIRLDSGGNPMFYVDKSGSVYASGTIIATSFASATTYYGDGSNLTGISAGDATKVAKTGDTMTGPLVVSANSATGTLDVQNSGNGRAATFITSGATAALYVENQSGVANGMGVVAVNTANVVGGGNAGSFINTGAGNDEAAIYASHSGATATIWAENTNGASLSYGVAGIAESGGKGIYGLNNGTGEGVFGLNTSNGEGIYGRNSSTGIAIKGNHTGTVGNAGYFDTTDNTNTSSTIYALSGSATATVYAANTNGTSSGRGIEGRGNNGHGVAGFSGGTWGNQVAGVYGENFGTGFGVKGLSTSNGFGVYGVSTTNGRGVMGDSSGDGFGIAGRNNANGFGVYAENTDTGILYGGVHTGSAGQLVNLGTTAASDTFVVGRDGNVFASGSFITMTGYASATTYYGDGSNLTGISASDATKVAKTGDTMTGPLLVNFNTATESVRVTNNTGTGIIIDGNGATAATSSLFVTTNNTNASGNAIRGDNSGPGSGISGTNTSSGNGVYGSNSSIGRGVSGINTSTGYGVYGVNSGTGYAVYGLSSNAGTGKAGHFENNTAANTAAALSGVTAGTSATSYGVYGEAAGAGRGVFGFNTGAGYGVYGNNNSTGYGVYGENSNATTGKAGYFWNGNAANTAAALNGITFGTSATSYGVYGEAAGAGASLYAVNAGATGILLGGNHTGVGGNLIQLQSGGADKFVVGKDGSATATRYIAVTTGTDFAGGFLLDNAGSAEDAFWAETRGTGTAGDFEIDNAGSGGNAVRATTNGTGNLYFGDHTGGSGNLIQLQSGGADTFVVSKAGNVYATGSFITATGFASATTYYGDGSNLTGISASDNTKVLKTGDTMTGGLIVNFNTATESQKITNNTGTGLWIDGTGATVATSTLYAKTDNTNANGYAIRGDNAGPGTSFFGLNTSTTTGKAGYFSNINNANTAYALGGFTSGTSATSYGVYGSAAGGGSGVYGFNNSTGYGVYGYNGSATTGKAGYFSLINPANTAAALSGVTAGTGPAGYFAETNTANATDTLFITTNSNQLNSSLLGGDHTGTLGNLIRLKSGGGDKFVVDKTGGITASGTVTASSYVATIAAGGTAFTSSLGNVNGILVSNPGTQGNAAQFLVSSGGNPNPALKAANDGTGRAALLTSAAATETLYVISTSVDPASGILGGEAAGGALIDFSTNSNRVFYVDNNANVYASGSFYSGGVLVGGAGSYVAKAGDTMTGALAMSGANGDITFDNVGATISNTGGSVTVSDDLEATTLMANTDAYVNYDGPDSISSLYFYDGFSTTGQSLTWDDGNTEFDLSNKLNVNGIIAGTGDLQLSDFRAESGNAYLNYGGPDSNSSLYFYDGFTTTGQSLTWDDGNTEFDLSNKLNVNGIIAGTGDLQLSDFRAESGNAYLNYGGPDSNSSLYFYDGFTTTGQSLTWDDGNIEFDLSAKLNVNGDVTATAYYGDGSNLTGLVQEIGDTMSGALGIATNGATASLYVYQESNTDEAGYFEITSAASANVAALSGKTAGTAIQSYGVYGEAAGNGMGVFGKNTAGTGNGVYGEISGSGKAVYGWNDSSGDGVYGFNSGAGSTGYAVRGVSESNTTGKAGYFSNSNAANNAAALSGVTAGSAGTSYGVYGSAAGAGSGVYGYNVSAGAGVRGNNTSNGIGVYGENSSTGYGVYGNNTNAGNGVYGSAAGNGSGVSGYNVSTGPGVSGTNTSTGNGVNGQNSGTGRAGYFSLGNAANNSHAVQIDKAGGTGYYLYMGCAGGANNTGVWGNCSSRTLKNDITSLGRKGRAEMLDMVNSLDVVTYRYKADPSKLSVGLIAENTPELLTGPGHNQILTADAIGMLIAAVQAQQEEIEALKAEIKALKEEK